MTKIPSRLSVYRLKDCSSFITSVDLDFDLYKKTENNSIIIQYYVIHKNWNNWLKTKAVPLAHVYVSPSSGDIEFITWQPEYFNVESPSKLQQNIVNAIGFNNQQNSD